MILYFITCDEKPLMWGKKICLNPFYVGQGGSNPYDPLFGKLNLYDRYFVDFSVNPYGSHF